MPSRRLTCGLKPEMLDRRSYRQHQTNLSRKISIAAFLPQAPMTPPPGWLAAPQRYKPRMGVR